MKKLLISTIIISLILFAVFAGISLLDKNNPRTISNIDQQINKPKNILSKSSKEEATKLFTKLEADETLSIATFSGGCFWCMEGPFESMDGVAEVISGYSGGDLENPSYQDVISGNSGHRETVNIYFDSNIISFEELLNTYWRQVDPTDDGGQFVDRGTQYTTAIFYHDEEQKSVAIKNISALDASGKYEESIVTPVIPFESFYPAEDYHQDFYKNSETRYKQYKNNSGR